MFLKDSGDPIGKKLYDTMNKLWNGGQWCFEFTAEGAINGWDCEKGHPPSFGSGFPHKNIGDIDHSIINTIVSGYHDMKEVERLKEQEKKDNLERKRQRRKMGFKKIYVNQDLIDKINSNLKTGSVSIDGDSLVYKS